MGPWFYSGHHRHSQTLQLNTIILRIVPVHEIVAALKAWLGKVGNLIMLEAGPFQLSYNVVKHLRFQIFLWAEAVPRRMRFMKTV